MPKFPKPFFRSGRGWYVQVGQQQIRLADGPKNKDTEAAALTRYHQVMAESGRIQSAPQAGLSVAEVFDKFLDWCQKHREGRTYEGYLDYIQKFLDHLKGKATMPVASLRPFHIVEWVDSHEGWNDSTRRKAFIHIQRPFNFAAKLGYIPDNPVRHIEKPQAKRRDNPVTPEDFALLLSKVKQDDPFRDLLLFNWHAGVRPQEARHIEARLVQLV
jgi:integrase